ncbi:unnamed protein product [Urochloa humidicola]
MESTTTNHRQNNSENERKYMKELADKILLLATLVATATYAAGFSPPGGVWQDAAGHLPGDPMIRSTQYVRYLMFFYCNATAFASSLIVLVFIILVCFVWPQNNLRFIVIPMVLVMLLGLVSLIGAYAAGTIRDMFTAVYTSMLVAAVFTYVAIKFVLASRTDHFYRISKKSAEPSDTCRDDSIIKARRSRSLRELLMQLATLALTFAYGGGLSTPGGFWDSTEGGARPGEPILQGARLTVFFICNTTAFVASLLVVVVILIRRIRRTRDALWSSVIMLFGLLGSYLAGSCRETDTSAHLASLMGAIVAYMVLLVVAKIVIWKRGWTFVFTAPKIQGNCRNDSARLTKSITQLRDAR